MTTLKLHSSKGFELPKAKKGMMFHSLEIKETPIKGRYKVFSGNFSCSINGNQLEALKQQAAAANARDTAAAAYEESWKQLYDGIIAKKEELQDVEKKELQAMLEKAGIKYYQNDTKQALIDKIVRMELKTQRANIAENAECNNIPERSAALADLLRTHELSTGDNNLDAMLELISEVIAEPEDRYIVRKGLKLFIDRKVKLSVEAAKRDIISIVLKEVRRPGSELRKAVYSVLLNAESPYPAA